MGLTSTRMAKIIHISRGYLSELENGHADPSTKVLRAMEVELGINPEYVRDAVLPVFFDVKKFTPSGKQVSETVISDAFRKRENAGNDAFEQRKKVTENGPEYRVAPAQSGEVQQDVPRQALPLQPDALRMVVEVVLEQLEQRGLHLPAGKVAELVVLIYEHLAGEDVKEQQVEQTARRYLRLVA
jgi:transcriptional regulator with XRE-family HTH domain